MPNFESNSQNIDEEPKEAFVDHITIRLEEIRYIVENEPCSGKKLLMQHFIGSHGNNVDSMMDQESIFDHLSQLEQIIEDVRTK